MLTNRMQRLWLVCTVLLLLAPRVDGEEAEPKTLLTPHFKIVFHTQHRPLAIQFSTFAEETRRKVETDLGSSVPARTTIVLAYDWNEMKKLAPFAEIPPWAIGVAFSRKNLIQINLHHLSRDTKSLKQVFVHEWAHVALDHAVGFRPLPRWFQEGFAMHHSGEWSFDRIQVLTIGVLSGKLFDLDQIENNFPKHLSEVGLAYAQSIDFVSFLLGEFGPSAFRLFVKKLSAGLRFYDALETAFGLSLLQLEAKWLSDLKTRFSWVPILTSAAVVWFATTLIFVAAFFRRKRQKTAGLRRLEDEDPTFDEPGP